MGIPHIETRAVDPNAAPSAINVHWVNTVSKKHWYSVGTASVNDWILQTSGLEFYPNLGALPAIGSSGVLYLAIDTSKFYRWDGAAYVEVETGVSDHTLLSNIGTNTHAQIDTKLADLQTLADRTDSTGLSFGGEVTYNSPTTFNVAAGEGHIVDHSTNPPTKTAVSWGAQTNVTATLIASGQFTRIEVNNAGVISQTNTVQTDSDKLNKIQLGILVHDNLTSITNVFSAPNPDYNVVGSLRDLAEGIGTIIKSGSVYSANGANLNINRSAGTSFVWGRAYGGNKNFPSSITTSAGTAIQFYRVHQSGANTFTYSALQTAVDSANYNSGNALISVPSNKWQIQYIYFYPEHGNTYIVYGQNIYNSQSEAVAAIGRESTVHDVRFARASLRAFLVLRQGATALNDTAQAVFYSGGKFGSISPTGSAISSVTDLQSAYNASTNPEIVLDNTKTNAGMTIRNATTPVTGNLLEVQNNAGSTTHFSVDATGVKANTTASRALISDASGYIAPSTVTTTELGYVSGVTSAIQTQINGKEPTITAGTTAQYWRGDKSWQTLNTTAVTEGTNLYWTSARFDTAFGTKTTTNLTEGTNLYFTDARGRAVVLTGYAVGTNTAIVDTDTVLQAFGKTQGQLNAKEPTITAGTIAQYWRGDKSWQTLDKTAVGLSNVDNTSDANKPISTATQTALNLKVDGAASSTDNAIARFDGATGKIIQNSTVTISDAGNLDITTGRISNTGSSAFGKFAFASDQTFTSLGNNGVGYFKSTTSADGDYLIFGWTGENNWAFASGDNSAWRSITLQPFGGTVGIGETTPTARLHVKGSGSTSATKSFKVDNSANTEFLSVRDDGLVTINQFVSAKTANYTVLNTEGDCLFTNTGATGQVDFTLPTAAAGLEYRFYTNAAQIIRVIAGAGDVIRRGSQVTAAAGNVATTASLGNYFELVAIDATTWVMISSTENGAFTFT